MDDETRRLVHAALIVIKAQQRASRTTLQMLNALEKQLEALDAEPKEAERTNGNGNSRSRDTLRVG